MRALLLSMVLLTTVPACTTKSTDDVASATPASSSAVASTPKPPHKPSSAPPLVSGASSAAPTPSATLPKHKNPKGWKKEWTPAPADTDGVFEHLSDFVVTRKDVPDPKTCPIDGPFWEGGVSSFGRECSEENIATCAEVSQRLYESGRWECAKAYHGLICQKAPEVTKPPPGGGDYPMAGYPLCPPEKDPRLPWRDKELADPTKKGCFVDHDASACMKLAEAEKDPTRRQWLGQLAAAWE